MEPQESLCSSAGGEEALGQGQGHICVAPLREGRLAGVAGMHGARGGCEKLSGSLRLRLPRARGFCRALQGSAGVDERCGSHSERERELREGCKQRSDMIRFMF